MSNPVRLHKKVSTDEKIDKWALQNAHIILPLCLIMLVILFILLMYAIVGVSAVESGTYYNHLQGVI